MMGKKDFDYTITFPSTGMDMNSLSEIPTETRNVEKTSKEPVVFLLGWMGAEDRHLAKYTVIYQDLGFITIRHTVPLPKLFFQPGKSVPIVARNMLSLINKHDLTEHPIIFHTFSNAGGWLYYYISKALENDESKALTVKGCIFDSCPSPLSIKKTTRAFYRSQQGNSAIQIVLATFIFLYLVIVKAYGMLQSVVKLQSPLDFTRLPPYGAVKEPFRWPQLFIYSKTDDLVPYSYVESFATERRRLGVDVRLKLLDSPHILHYRLHPEEYTKTIEDFVHDCLKTKQF